MQTITEFINELREWEVHHMTMADKTLKDDGNWSEFHRGKSLAYGIVAARLEKMEVKNDDR